ANTLGPEKTGISLELEPSPATLLCDREKILRLLQNLFNNAVEAMAGKPGRVRLSASNSNGVVQIRVAANAPASPEPIRPNIVEPSDTAGKATGTGVSLSIVTSVVAAHDGTVTLETASGHGTAFILTLPAFDRPADS